jgi:glycerol-3-phosphate acyltransferase PlsY
LDSVINQLAETRALLVMALSLLVGSIPFGLVFTMASGVDIRKTGSGNIGATNVLRAAGKRAAILTLMGDMLKGVAAVALARALGLGAVVEGAAGLCSVLGHDFSVFLRFRGGKGVATSLGFVLIYIPMAGILTCIVWLLTVLAARYSSLGAVVSFSALPAVVWAVGGGKEKLVFSAIITILLLYKHRTNISNILKGTESKVGKNIS